MKKYDGTMFRSGRVDANLSQEQAASLLNISARVLSDWERGESLPSDDMIVAMEKVYGDNELMRRHLIANTPYGKLIPEPKEMQSDSEFAMQFKFTAKHIKKSSRKAVKYLENDGKLDKKEIEELLDEIPELEEEINKMTGYINYIKAQSLKLEQK